MKKYWVVFTNSLNQHLTYRFDFFTLLLAEVISLGVMVYLWYSIYSSGGEIGSYSFSGLILYYVFTKIITLTISSYDVSWIVGDEIREGNIINYILRPINYFYYHVASYFGAVSYRLLIFSFAFFIGIFFFVDAGFWGLNIVYFILFTILGVIVNFLIFYLIGILTFYLGYIAGFNFIVQTFLLFLSGKLIPVDLFPSFLVGIIDFLPFKYIYFIPVSIALGNVQADQIGKFFLIDMGWILILSCFVVIVFNKGIKKYEAYGR